jgi:hypothetical protein
VNRLLAVLVVYTAAGTLCMLTGFLGPTVKHYVGLMWALPAALAAVVACAITARHAPAGDLCRAWVSLTCALGLYFVGECIGVTS